MRIPSPPFPFAWLPGVLAAELVAARHDAAQQALLAAPAAPGSAAVRRSNLGGWQSEQDIMHWAEEPVRAAIRRVGETRLAALRHLGLTVEGLALTGGWTNVLPPGGQNLPHAHSGADWVAVLYVRGCGEDEALAPQHDGALVLIQRRAGAQ